jgi:hypothetical protein
MSEVVHGVSDCDGCGDRGWFMPIADEFVTRIGGGRHVGGRSGNLDEAALCIAIEGGARESSRRGGVSLPLPAPAGSRPARAGSIG